MNKMDADDLKIGGKIRQLRRQRGLNQAVLAKELGISASYLNLIEHNRRKLTVPLLLKLAKKFGLEISDLAESDEARLSGDLMEMFSDSAFGDLDLTNHDVREFANSSPAVARAVVHLYDQYRAAQETADATPTEQRLASELVSDFLQNNGNYFAGLEDVARRIASDIGTSPPNFDLLASYLMNVFGISTRLGPVAITKSSAFNEGRGTLTVSDVLPPESRVFTLAKFLGLKAAEGAIEPLIESAMFATEAVEKLARSALGSYVAGAILMPYSTFLASAEETRYDIERLSMRYGVSFEQACHRLTTLQRPGENGVPFHLIRTDIAGNISKRFSISGIQIPRHGGACPRWNVYEAFLQPNRITIQISQMPEGQRFFCIARTLTKGENRHDASLRHMSIGLGCNINQAHRLVYSDGIDLQDKNKITPVGVSCRICPLTNCTVRAFPAIISTRTER